MSVEQNSFVFVITTGLTVKDALKPLDVSPVIQINFTQGESVFVVALYLVEFQNDEPNPDRLILLSLVDPAEFGQPGSIGSQGVAFLYILDDDGKNKTIGII